jgi:hypothetical protein
MTMKLHTAHAAALTLAVVAASAATPSFAKAPHVHVTQSAATAMAYDDGNIVDGHYAPGSTGYGRWAYNPEQPTDPDPRIGGALKLNTDR